MIRHPQRSTRPHPPFPDLTLLRAKGENRYDGRALYLNVRWAPALLDSTEVDALSAAMPGPITALARADARSVTLDVLGDVVDAIVTEAAERVEVKAPPPTTRPPATVAAAFLTRLAGSHFRSKERRAWQEGAWPCTSRYSP